MLGTVPHHAKLTLEVDYDCKQGGWHGRPTSSVSGFPARPPPGLCIMHVYMCSDSHILIAGGASGRADPSGAGALVPSTAGRPQRAEQAGPEALGLVDAGLMSGHSFRVGWAPGGRFASESAGLSDACLSHVPPTQQLPFENTADAVPSPVLSERSS